MSGNKPTTRSSKLKRNAEENIDTDEPGGPPTTGFNDLPPEVIRQIFRLLPYPYFQVVRQVCQLWYEVATSDAYISDQEETVCIRNWSISKKDHQKQQVEPMLASKRDFLHFRFEGRNTNVTDKQGAWWSDWGDHYDANFWERLGPKVTSLSLNWCQIKINHVRDVLSFCPNLRSLEFTCCFLGFTFQQDDEDRVVNKFPELNSLKSLRFLSTHDVPKDLFSALVSHAPNLQSLMMEYSMHPPKEGTDESGNTRISPNDVVNYIERNADRIIDVGLYYNTDKNLLRKLLKIPNLKLRYLSTNFPIENQFVGRLQSLEKLVRKDSVVAREEVRAIKRLNSLKHVELKKLGSCLFVHELTELPNLESLHVNITRGGRAHEDVLDLLQRIIDWESTFLNENPTLRELTVAGKYGDLSSDAVTRLALTHPNLTYFCGKSGVTDKSAQAIFEHLGRLKSLKIKNCKSFTDLFGEKSRSGHSIHRLKELTSLILLDCAIPAQSLKNLVLPELRELRLDALKVPQDCLIALIKNHPWIETLDLALAHFNNTLVNAIIENLPRLRYLYVWPYSNVSAANLKKLQRHCKSVNCSPKDENQDDSDDSDSYERSCVIS